MADSSSVATGIKRKRPPTFQYYPTDRAKKLKKAWVEKTKIKSKWKAQKKKEGLATNSKLDIPVYDEEEGDVEDNSKSHSDDVQPTASPTRISGEQLRPHLHPSRAHIHPELPVKRSKARTPDAPPTKMQKISKEDSQPVEPPSLRELKREAYSQSALHTFKSNPLKKRDQGRKDGGSNTKRFIERGRGQPNMKLRMNVMLENIKQNFA
ncbi:hypothetical protein BYT27DRAFT_6726284 [Phlegmacium glaucopus]|nr:hypothetical protein BYT27DRAFT_6726284 [Phlegmacium glaucopus]